MNKTIQENFFFEALELCETDSTRNFNSDTNLIKFDESGKVVSVSPAFCRDIFTSEFHTQLDIGGSRIKYRNNEKSKYSGLAPEGYVIHHPFKNKSRKSPYDEIITFVTIQEHGRIHGRDDRKIAEYINADTAEGNAARYAITEAFYAVGYQNYSSDSTAEYVQSTSLSAKEDRLVQDVVNSMIKYMGINKPGQELYSKAKEAAIASKNSYSQGKVRNLSKADFKKKNSAFQSALLKFIANNSEYFSVFENILSDAHNESMVDSPASVRGLPLEFKYDRSIDNVVAKVKFSNLDIGMRADGQNDYPEYLCLRDLSSGDAVYFKFDFGDEYVLCDNNKLKPQPRKKISEDEANEIISRLQGGYTQSHF